MNRFAHCLIPSQAYFDDRYRLESRSGDYDKVREMSNAFITCTSPFISSSFEQYQTQKKSEDDISRNEGRKWDNRPFYDRLYLTSDSLQREVEKLEEELHREKVSTQPIGYRQTQGLQSTGASTSEELRQRPETEIRGGWRDRWPPWSGNGKDENYSRPMLESKENRAIDDVSDKLKRTEYIAKRETGGARQGLERVGGEIRTAGESTHTPVIDDMKAIAHDVKRGVQTTARDARIEAEDIGETLRRNAAGMIDNVVETGQDIKEGIRDVGRDVKRGTQNLAGEAAEVTKDLTQGAKEATYDLKRGAEEAGRDIKENVQEAGRDLRRGVQDADRAVSERSQLWVDAKATGRDIKEGVKDIGRDIKQGAKGIGEEVNEGVRESNRQSSKGFRNWWLGNKVSAESVQVDHPTEPRIGFQSAAESTLESPPNVVKEQKAFFSMKTLFGDKKQTSDVPKEHTREVVGEGGRSFEKRVYKGAEDVEKDIYSVLPRKALEYDKRALEEHEKAKEYMLQAEEATIRAASSYASKAVLEKKIEEERVEALRIQAEVQRAEDLKKRHQELYEQKLKDLRKKEEYAREAEFLAQKALKEEDKALKKVARMEERARKMAEEAEKLKLKTATEKQNIAIKLEEETLQIKRSKLEEANMAKLDAQRYLDRLKQLENSYQSKERNAIETRQGLQLLEDEIRQAQMRLDEYQRRKSGQNNLTSALQREIDLERKAMKEAQEKANASLERMKKCLAESREADRKMQAAEETRDIATRLSSYIFPSWMRHESANTQHSRLAAVSNAEVVARIVDDPDTNETKVLTSGVTNVKIIPAEQEGVQRLVPSATGVEGAQVIADEVSEDEAHVSTRLAQTGETRLKRRWW